MKFYMTPGSCSTGIHILLEELELLFEVQLIDLLAGDNQKPEYLQLNPKGTIPTLVTDQGIILTEFTSIACWLARSYPRYQLMPAKVDEKALVLKVLNYVVKTVHGEGFSRIFTTENYSSDAADYEGIKTEGRNIVESAFAQIHQWISDTGYVTGQFSIADAALFFVEFWADRTNIPLPAHCQLHYQKMLQRPVVRQVLSEEGYGAMFQR